MALQYQKRLQADICPCCKKSRSAYDTNSWDDTLDHLHAAALQGCPRCALLARCIRLGVPDAFSRGGSFRARGNFFCTIRLIDSDLYEDGIQLDIFALASQNRTPFKDIKSGALLTGSTSSPNTFATIRSWMNECLHGHTACLQAPVKDPTQLPTRILDLRDGRVKLQEAEHLSERVKYACLSHCWGPPQNVSRTTMSNLHEFMSNIEWAILPKTFQEAIDTCRSLDIDFLWIDSLCIIQDSEEDWMLESAKMGSIYKNSWLTIAATRAKQSSDGLYTTTDPIYLARLLEYGNIYVRQKPPTFPTHWSHNESEMWPLFNRGWIYQEMRLSHRVLHFCTQEVMWECSCSRRSESGRSDEDFATDKRHYAHTQYEAVPYWKLAENPRLLWYRTVQEYSRLQLTFPRDKMPGLAALTKQTQELRSTNRFVAGLWEKTLLLDLVWMAWPSPESGRADIWLAPTWSWASIQTQVMWDQTADSVLAGVSLFDVVCSYSGAAQLGYVSEGARITLHAPIIQGTWNSRGLCLDGPLAITNQLVPQDYKSDYNFDTPGPYHIRSGSPVFIVPLSVSATNRRCYCLVLRKKPGASVHERIGYVELSSGALERGSNADTTSLSRYNQEKKLAIDRMKQFESLLTGLPYVDIVIV